MKTLRLLTLTLLLTLGVGIPSCTVCDCPPLEGNYFRPENAFLSNYRKLTEVQSEYMDEFDTVALENYRIALEFQLSYYGSTSPSHSAPFSLMNSAYACTCQENGKLGSKEKIENMNLLTVNDFNDQYQAGDTINELFELLVYGDTLSIAEFTKQELRPESYTLHLKEKPTTAQPFQLKLLLVLDNGKMLQATSKPIVIK